MPEDRMDFIPSALPAAIEESLFELFTCWGRWSRAELQDAGDYVRLVTGVATSMFNGIFRVRLRPDGPGGVDARIEEALTPFRERNLAAFWMVGPTTEPADLAVHLRGDGWRHLDDAPGMAADLGAASLDDSAPDALDIRRVRGVDRLNQYNAAMNEGFGSPRLVRDAFLQLFSQLGLSDEQPLRHYVGYADVGHSKVRPVASSSLLLGARVAGIYNVATVPDARGQGFGTAMTRAAMRDARAAGYRVAVLHASHEGYSLYRRLGFEEHCTISWYEHAGGSNRA
jgi:ribosomal protein S18 acetylase RimI-like enzyme